MSRLLAALGLALIVATGVVALVERGNDSSGGSSGSKGASGAAKRADAVTIKDFEYGPPVIKVKVGTKVTWTNEDSTEHTATSRATTGAGGSPVFTTDTIKSGKPGTATLERPGEFAYYCQFHATMSGKVIVEP